MADVKVNTGTTVGMSATLPTTYDGHATTGYTPVVFTDIGEVIDIGEIAKAFNVIEHQTVTRDYPQKLKDTYNIANVTLTLGKVDSNTGQVLLQTALAADASYSFKFTLPAGVAYVTAKVIKAGLGAIASGAVSTTTVELTIDPNTLFEA